MSSLLESIKDGGGGHAIVASGAVTVPANSKVIAYTSFVDGATITTTGTNFVISGKTIPKGITIFGRWDSLTGNTSDQGIAYFG